MVLTEKVRGSMGGYEFRVFKITAISGSTTGVETLSLDALAMNHVQWSELNWTAHQMTATALNPPVLKIAACSGEQTNLTISGTIGSATADAGYLTVWGW